MTRSVSVVVPVKNGERYLQELLTAVSGQAADAESLQILVIDSGSTDSSVTIARAAGADVVEIDAETFSHGSTRNLGAEQTTGEIICFLTQDATPVPGWLQAVQDSFDLDDRVGAVYGPHLVRPDTSPMIARELTEFFAGHARNGGATVQRAGDEPFLSNVNAAYLRRCWEEIRFDDVPYAEDQAFGRAMLARGWAKVFNPQAAVLHAHDYPPLEFMRRYFDEYRGLRETTGHVEAFGLRSGAGHVRSLVAQDRQWMRAQGFGDREVARWTARSAIHHAGRRVFSAAGSRAERLPSPVQRRLSLEGRGAATGATTTAAGGPPTTEQRPAMIDRPVYADIVDYLRNGSAPLLDPVPGMAESEALHLAFVIPEFRRGSGGHNSIFQQILELERMGHTCSIWVHDSVGLHKHEWDAVLRHDIREWFAPVQAPVRKGFEHWIGADVVLATGWQTVYPMLQLPGCRARAYLVHDHENEFYATSVESRWAQDTYRFGLYCIAGSPWLSDLMTGLYGAQANVFPFGVDHEVYFPRPIEREPETVVFYGRGVTQRRAVALGMLALDELKRRRPGLRVVIFGDPDPPHTSFPYEHAGVATPEELAFLYSQGTVGLVLSLTNYSLIPQEMLACGMPCVDLAGYSSESVFGSDGPVELAEFDPGDLAAAIERLLDDPERWERDSARGIEFVRDRTWRAAAEAVDAGVRKALSLREQDPAAS